MKKIGVLGAGTWGMALARMLCNAGNEVIVWSAIGAEIDELSTSRRHPKLPDMVIPQELQFTKSIEEVCRGKDILLFAVPSVFVRSTAASARPFIPDGQVIVDVAKGIEADTLMTMSEVIRSELEKNAGTAADGQEGTACKGPAVVKIVALSGVLTLAIDSMKDTIDAIKAAGLNDVKVIIGGAPVSESAKEVTGADEWAYSPQKTVQVCKEWAKLN